MLYIIALIVLAVLLSLALQIRTLNMVKDIPEFIIAMQSRLASLETVEESVKTLLSTQAAQLVAIRAELANKGVPPEQLASLDQFLTTLDSDAAALTAAAVATSTAAEGESAPEPQPEPVPVDIVTTELPAGQVGEDYTATIEITGGTGPYTLVSSPPTDNGITINEDASVTGAPTEAKDSSFVLTATDSLGATANGSVTLHVDSDT